MTWTVGTCVYGFYFIFDRDSMTRAGGQSLLGGGRDILLWMVSLLTEFEIVLYSVLSCIVDLVWLP